MTLDCSMGVHVRGLSNYSLFWQGSWSEAFNIFCTVHNIISAVLYLFCQDQKKQVKSASQRLKNVLNFLERSLLRAKVTKKEKQKIAEEKEILEHTQLTEIPKPKPKAIPEFMDKLINPVGVRH